MLFGWALVASKLALRAKRRRIRFAYPRAERVELARKRQASEFSALPRYPYGRSHVPFRASRMFPYDEAQGKGILAKGEIPID